MPKSADRPELSQDALVEALVPDPAGGPPDATVLRGYLGRGTVEGTWRLYLTAALDDYVEIPEDKILHSHKLSEDRGTMVWVPKGLALQRKQITSEAVQAEFLAGSIEQGRAAAFAGIRKPVGLLGHPSEFCPSAFLVCRPSQPVILCPTEPVICIASALQPCASARLQCPSEPVICYPSARLQCPSETRICVPTDPRGYPC